MKIPLVFFSGLLSSPSLWHHQAEHLKDLASIQIFSPSQNSAEKMVHAILEQAPAKFALAGHSMGGWLCLELMRAAPSRITKLCLINTTARADSKEKRAQREEMIQQAKLGQFPKIVEQIVDKFVYNSHVKERAKNMFLEAGPQIFINQEMAMLHRQETHSILSTICCPTLLIHAAQDKNFSLEEHQQLAEGIKGSKLAIVEDCGHMSPIEMPQAITTLLRLWLSYNT